MVDCQQSILIANKEVTSWTPGWLKVKPSSIVLTIKLVAVHVSLSIVKRFTHVRSLSHLSLYHVPQPLFMHDTDSGQDYDWTHAA